MKLRNFLFAVFAVVLIFGTASMASAKTGNESKDFKAIKGVRKTYENTENIENKEWVQQKIHAEKAKILYMKLKMQKLKGQLLAYQKIKTETDVSGTVFADNGRGTDLFYEVSGFDSYFKRIVNYGNVNENLLSSDYLESNIDNTDSLYLASLVSDKKSAVVLLESGNTDAVDISTYLSYKIYRKQERIQALRTRLQKVRGRVKHLKRKSGHIVTDDIVFNSMDVTEISNISKGKMREILAGTELEKYADVYVDIEKKYGINAIAICALSALESGWGESRRAKEDNNYTGFGVYSASAKGINASSGTENLMMTAEHLAKCYLVKGEVYYHGVGLDGLNRSYSSARTWAYDIENIGIYLMEQLS